MYQTPPWARPLDLTWVTWPADSAAYTEPLASLVSPSVSLVSLRSLASESESAARLESTHMKKKLSSDCMSHVFSSCILSVN